jgi:hypothetical protein
MRPNHRDAMRRALRCLIAILPLAAASQSGAVTFASHPTPPPVGTLLEALPMPGFGDVLAQLEVVEGPGYNILLEPTAAIAPADPSLFPLGTEPVFVAAADR